MSAKRQRRRFICCSVWTCSGCTVDFIDIFFWKHIFHTHDIQQNLCTILCALCSVRVSESICIKLIWLKRENNDDHLTAQYKFGTKWHQSNRFHSTKTLIIFAIATHNRNILAIFFTFYSVQKLSRLLRVLNSMQNSLLKRSQIGTSTIFNLFFTAVFFSFSISLL